MSVRVLYFGVWSPEHKGHYLYTPSGFPEYQDSVPRFLHPDQIDGKLCPVETSAPYGQPEGLALLHDMPSEWTAIAFWDRSGDSRPNSNSIFLAKGKYGFHQMLSISRDAFPSIWKRFSFEVRLCGKAS
jgi:hypothetical protein